MKIIPLELFISDVAAIGFMMFGPAALFLLIGVILAATKNKKPAKIFLIMGGVCLLVALGLCGIDML